MLRSRAVALGVAWRRPPALQEPRVVPGLLRASARGIDGTGLAAPSSCRSTANSVMPPMSEVESVKKKGTGHFGIEFFGGRRAFDITYESPDPPKDPYKASPYSLEFAKYPGTASGLGGEYFFRPGQRHPLTYYHIRSPTVGDQIAVGATSPRAREARTIDNYVKERTRGYAVQLILEGRGVKAYWEPKFPQLKVRLGVGAKVQDLSEYCTRDPDVEVSINKVGSLVILHGPNKARVGTLAYRLLRRMQTQLQAYTGKGAHVAFHPMKRKPVRKK